MFMYVINMSFFTLSYLLRLKLVNAFKERKLTESRKLLLNVSSFKDLCFIHKCFFKNDGKSLLMVISIRGKVYIFIFCLQAADVEVTRTTNPAPKPAEGATLKFGHHFSDHMLEIEWCKEAGWGKPKICPVHNLSLHPGAKCLHYAVEVGCRCIVLIY